VYLLLGFINALPISMQFFSDEVDRVSPHTLRHTFATKLYRETGKIYAVQKALGHSDLSTMSLHARRGRGAGDRDERTILCATAEK
jgi:integrase